jgi:hypothetical protein
MPDTYEITVRKDRTGLPYHLLKNGRWKNLSFNRQMTLDELEQEFGPTSPVEVDNVAALLTAYVEMTADRDAMVPIVVAAQKLALAHRIGGGIDKLTALVNIVTAYEAGVIPVAVDRGASTTVGVGEETSAVPDGPQNPAQPLMPAEQFDRMMRALETAPRLAADLAVTVDRLNANIEQWAKEIAAPLLAELDEVKKDRDLADECRRDGARSSMDALRQLQTELDEARVTLRAFVEPGGQWDTQYGNGRWDCWGDGGHLGGPDTHQRRVFYGPPEPISAGKPGSHGQSPPAGKNDHGDDWGPLPHPPWPTDNELRPVALEAHDATVDTISGATPMAAKDGLDADTR